MESRLRTLLSPRKVQARQQANDVAELDLHSVPYTTAPSQGRLPVIFNHALGKTSSVKVCADAPGDLRSFSYETTVPGRPPQLGDRPQRGNGPVKLQTSRRLSSGELLATEQDYDRTLDDIRQGDYILGGKDRRTSETKSPTQLFDSRPWSNGRSASTSTNPPWSPPSALSDDATSGVFSSGRHFSDFSDQMYYSGSNSSTTGLGISSPSQHPYSPYTGSTTSLLEPHEERNPTIQALCKAEYSRLASIYGQEGVDWNLTQLNYQDYLNKPLPEIDHRTMSTRNTSHSSFHQPLHPPRELAQRGLGIKNIISAPQFEPGYLDDHSEQSSNHQRNSLRSSTGNSSSFTTRTSMVEESMTTREDLRKIVDDMRQTYLHAIEAHTPPLPPMSDAPRRKPRSKKPKATRSLTSPVSVESGLAASSRQPKPSRSRSWQSWTTLPQTSVYSPLLNPSGRRSRTSSAPGRRVPSLAMPTLPAIQASPARGQPGLQQDQTDVDADIDIDVDVDINVDDDVNVDNGESIASDGPTQAIGLKRADSTTLGSMASKLTIIDNRASNSSSNTTSTSTSTSISSPTFSNSSDSPEPGSETDYSYSNVGTTSPSPSLKQSPSSSSLKRPSPSSSSSIHQTPEHPHQPSPSYYTPTADPRISWHDQRRSDRLCASSDVNANPNLNHKPNHNLATGIDIDVDIDDFESLCDDLFSTPPPGKGKGKGTGTGSEPESPDIFQTPSWIARASPSPNFNVSNTNTLHTSIHGIGVGNGNGDGNGISTGSPRKRNKRRLGLGLGLGLV